DDFFFAISILHATYVDNQQDRALNGSNGVLALFTVDDPILAEHYIGIIEYARGTLERYAVLLLVDLVLLVIPFKSHRYTKCITPAQEESTPRCPDSGFLHPRARRHRPACPDYARCCALS